MARRNSVLGNLASETLVDSSTGAD